jgi:putative flippase GtrA
LREPEQLLIADDMSIRNQLLRYGIVGIASNASIYVLYLLMTAIGMGPKLAMSLLYMLGVLQTFVFNKSWTFRYVGQGRAAFWRHVVLYVVGYLVQLLLLALMVDTLHWRHQWVMAGVVLLMAVFFFLGQKFWVFRPSSIVNVGG